MITSNKIIITLLAVFCIAILQSCTVYDDTYLKIKVIDRPDGQPVSNIVISVTKFKRGLILGSTQQETYSGTTNSNGECMLMINNYDSSYLWFSVEVNSFTDYGGFIYSHESATVYPNDFGNVIVLKVTKIPIPNTIRSYSK